MLKQILRKDNKNLNHLPNLVIIGAMKSGTSSLHMYLNLHPQIFMSHIKELDFFIEKKNWRRGLEWYKSNFNESAEVRGESSPNYTKYHFYKGVPQRMHSIIPDTKLIYIVRDPIKRMVSHYIHMVASGMEKRNFGEAVTEFSNINDYVKCSQYYMQIEQFLAYYPPARILVISSEYLASARTETLSKVFRFLNVETNFQHDNFERVLHTSKPKKAPTELGCHLEKLPGGNLVKSGIFRLFRHQIASELLYRPIEQPILDESLRQTLVDILSEDVAKLRSFTGCPFTNWSL